MKSKSTKRKTPTLAVWKFASCDGCQLSLLDCEDELLAVFDRLRVAKFTEATRAAIRGPYDLSLVEGSVSTPEHIEQIEKIRQQSRYLVTIGACATSGGIQALRNFANAKEYLAVVYASPEYIQTLHKSTAIADHVRVDFELRGCPINKRQLLEVIAAFLNRRKPNVPRHAVCIECKLRGIPCVMVSGGVPCLGPVTQAGCGAICPSFDRGCYGCYGPMETPNTGSLAGSFKELGVSEPDLVRAFRTFNANAEAFREESESHGG
jgi:sulfhydrogenase subunit delta